MKRVWPWILVILAILPAALMRPARPTAPPVPSTFAIAVFDRPNALDPAAAVSLSARLMADNLFTPLFVLGSNGDLRPGLAESASVSGRTITITLSRTARLSNGQPVTAALVRASLSHVLWPAVHSPVAPLLADVVGAAAVAQGHAQWLSGIQVVGRRTLIIRLAAADPGFLMTLANPALGIFPVQDLVAGGRYWTAADLVGTGGYRLADWAPRSLWEFTTEGGGAGPRRVQVVWYPTRREALLSLANGQVSAVPLTLSEVPAALQNRWVRHDVRFLADGGRMALVVDTATPSAWTTAGQAASTLARVDWARVLSQAFYGRVPPIPGAWATLETAFGAPPPPPGPSNGVGAAPTPPPSPLPLVVDRHDPWALRLAETWAHLYPATVSVTVLGPAAFSQAVTQGTAPAYLASLTPAAPGPSGARTVIVSLCPTGSFWALAPAIRQAGVYADGSLDLHSIR